jgi:hypothetical protein
MFDLLPIGHDSTRGVAWKSHMNRNSRLPLIFLIALCGCGVVSTRDATSQKLLACHPADKSIAAERLKRDHSFNLVTVLQPVGRPQSVLFENTESVRNAIRQAYFRNHGASGAFSSNEIADLLSGKLIVASNLKFAPGGSDTACGDGAVLQPGSWAGADYLDALRKKVILLDQEHNGSATRQGRFQPGFQASCNDIAALLHCSLFVARDDYSGQLVITVKSVD